MKALMTIIPMVSVAVMIIWGMFANDWGRSWIAVFIGGILMVCVGAYDNAKKEKDKKDEK